MKLFLVSGFLGSGKTTAIHQAALAFYKMGIKVAVITNDQGADLVDTAFMRDAGLPTEEVLQGCFCCHYDHLSSAIFSLQATEMPEAIFAESVGSCTDIIASIAKPFNKFNPEIDVVVSTFVDVHLLHAIIMGKASFLNDDVRYIFQKQMEEGDILIINKIDLLPVSTLQKVKKFIQAEYGSKEIIYQNSLKQENVRPWMELLSTFQPRTRTSLHIDYDQYARGEAILAWLDQYIIVKTTDNSADRVGLQLIHAISKNIKRAKYPIAHLKFFIDDGQKRRKISFTALDDLWEEVITPEDHANEISMLMNARIQVDFHILERLVSKAIAEIMNQTGSEIVVHKKSAFAPGYPRPTHRITI